MGEGGALSLLSCCVLPVCPPSSSFPLSPSFFRSCYYPTLARSSVCPPLAVSPPVAVRPSSLPPRVLLFAVPDAPSAPRQSFHVQCTSSVSYDHPCPIFLSIFIFPCHRTPFPTSMSNFRFPGAITYHRTPCPISLSNSHFSIS